MNKKAILSIIITVVLVWFLLSQVEVQEIVTSLKDVPPHLVLIGFFFYALSYLFRALRFRVLLQKAIGLGTLFNIVAVHTMWTNLLPFRTGELSYLYLLKKKGGVGSYLTGVPSLVLARVFDLVAISVLFIISFVGVGTLPEEIRVSGVILLFLVFSLLSFALFLIWKREQFLGRVKYHILKMNLDKLGVVEKILGKSGEILDGFNEVKSWKSLSLVAVFSFAVWILIYLCNYAIILAVGIELNLLHIFFISTFFVLVSLFPVHGWAGFGTTEAVWVLTIVWFGIVKETAIVTGFQLHILGLLFTIILGITGWISIRFRVGDDGGSKGSLV